MAELDKDLQELKKEVVEARNLVIKTDNLLKNLQADVKGVARKQEVFERRAFATSATAYILFAGVAALGAFMYARSEMRAKVDELVKEQAAHATAKTALAELRGAESELRTESARALELYERLGGENAERRRLAIGEVATLEPKKLSALEVRALKDKAHSLRQMAANEALEAGRSAFNRKDYRTAAQELQRHANLSPDKPEDVALLLLGQSHHALREWKDAVEVLERFLKAAPGSKSADYVTLLLGESLGESGERERAIEVYRSGADRFPASQFAPWMRTRARKLEQAGQPPGSAGAN
jgi:TolA-binding protein